MNDPLIRISRLNKIANRKGLEIDNEVEKEIEKALKIFLSRCIKRLIYYSKSQPIQSIHLKIVLSRHFSTNNHF
jgi:hypothetical protein